MSETAKEPKKISKRSSEEKIEIIVAIFLGITALATAWASWIGSLHGGNQATNYTKSNNLSSEGNSMWNEASQNLMQDMITWNDINEANLNYQYAESKNDKAEMEKYQYQIDQLMSDNCTEEFLEAINWAMDQKENVTPFMKDGYTESYFAEAQATIEESDKLLEQGKKDNANGDAFGSCKRNLLGCTLYARYRRHIQESSEQKNCARCCSCRFYSCHYIYVYNSDADRIQYSQLFRNGIKQNILYSQR